jgi:predicted HicB family RNase H-like nuclease
MDAALARMHHGDYVAELVYEAVTGLFRGHVINLERGVLDFWGSSLKELRAAFARSVQAHEQICRDAGREPERPRPAAE